MAFDFCLLSQRQGQIKFVGLPEEIANNLSLCVVSAKESEDISRLLQIEFNVFDVLLDFVKTGTPHAIKRIIIEYFMNNGTDAVLTQTFKVEYNGGCLSGLNYESNKKLQLHMNFTILQQNIK